MITRTNTTYDTGAAVTTTEALFVGATLAVHWNSTRVMSDVWENCPYATVFNAATGKVEVVWRSSGPAEVDATPEAIAGANAWLLSVATAGRKGKWASRVAEAVAAASKPSKGKTVIVTKGRKVPKGTTGEVFWVGEGTWGLRLGFKDAAGVTHWTAASNVEVVNPDEHFDFEAWVTNEPNHEADALAALNFFHPHKYAEVLLFAGEDRIGFSNWFAAPVAVKGGGVMLCYDFKFGGEHLTLVKAEGRTAEQAREHAIYTACDLGIGLDSSEAPYERRSKLQRADVTLVVIGKLVTV